MHRSAPEPIFETLLCLEDGAHTAEENMARDAALLGSATGLLAKPQLRFYSWLEECVSYGCFLTARDAEAVFPGLPHVQRPTGGGVLRHGFGRDLTYSLVVPYPAGYPRHTQLPAGHLLRLGVGESYCAIHRALAAALESVGVECRLAGAEESNAAGTKPGACFARPTAGDLLDQVDGGKLAGAAQKRTRRGLLHQGSVFLPEAVDHRQAARAFAKALGRKVEFAPYPGGQ